MRITTWNVNGLRASLKKGLLDYLRTAGEIVALQETKANAAVPEAVPDGYGAGWCFADRPGYSGTLCLYKQKPMAIKHGLGNAELDGEGRLITLDYPAFYFVNVYVPTSQGGLDRWYYRLAWDEAFAEHLSCLQRRKPLVVAGDFNVARDYIDIYPENLRNEKNPAGFLPEERDAFNTLLDLGLVDVFRELHPSLEGAYTWWSGHNRKENKGRRIDYILVSSGLMSKVKSCAIRADVTGSDHAPVELVIAL
jgi:exodeoxyribonuclease-3